LPVFLANAIEDSTDIFGISGGDWFESPNPTAVRHCHRSCHFHCLEVCCVILLDYNTLYVLTVLLVIQRTCVVWKA